MRRLTAMSLGFTLSAPLALGGVSAGVPDYDFGWSVIGDPGNRAATREEAPGFWNSAGNPIITVGAVDHVYRMATTEVTCTQYVEFLNAYRHHTSFALNDLELTGIHVGYNPDTDAFAIMSGHEHAGVAVTWRMAARYANWLHNGKGNQASDFETGAYDTTTFTLNDDGTFNDQATHNAGSRFWLPTLDEWVKAAHWDPQKNGGEGGYWYYPNGSDEPPVYASPNAGGTSNGGTDSVFGVASYDAMGPWGLFDTSGGESEWTGTLNPTNSGRFVDGSNYFIDAERRDRLDAFGRGNPYASFQGFRLSSVVPPPGGLCGILPAALWHGARRRRGS